MKVGRVTTPFELDFTSLPTNDGVVTIEVRQAHEPGRVRAKVMFNAQLESQLPERYCSTFKPKSKRGEEHKLMLIANRKMIESSHSKNFQVGLLSSRATQSLFNWRVTTLFALDFTSLAYY